MASVVVNNIPYDFQSMEVEFVGNGTSFGIVDGLDQIDYTVKIQRTKFYGRSRLPLNRTEGDAEFDASLTMNRDWWHKIRSQAQQAGVPLAMLEIALAVTYYAPDQVLHTDTLTGVRMMELKSSGQHGPDPLMMSMPLDVMNIYFDGEDVFGNKI